MNGYHKIKARFAGNTIIDDGATLTLIEKSPEDALDELTTIEELSTDTRDEDYGDEDHYSRWCQDTTALIEGAYGGSSLRLLVIGLREGWATEVRFAPDQGRWV